MLNEDREIVKDAEAAGQDDGNKRKRRLGNLHEFLILTCVVSACIAATAWLFHFLGLTWEQWPPLRWLCIIPTLLAIVPIAVQVTVRVWKWAAVKSEEVAGHKGKEV